QAAAQSWRDEYAKQVRAAGIEELIACPDNDDAGRGYVQEAGAALTGLGIAVRDRSCRDEYSKQVRAAGIAEPIACPDNDDAGRGYVQAAGAALTGLGIAV